MLFYSFETAVKNGRSGYEVTGSWHFGTGVVLLDVRFPAAAKDVYVQADGDELAAVKRLLNGVGSPAGNSGAAWPFCTSFYGDQAKFILANLR